MSLKHPPALRIHHSTIGLEITRAVSWSLEQHVLNLPEAGSALLGHEAATRIATTIQTPTILFRLMTKLLFAFAAHCKIFQTVILELAVQGCFADPQQLGGIQPVSAR